ncbi:hypothetical protein Barb7_02217 [Bacteroidales bacterium Barb7]|nr:hypothetical protein Barb7_02217 [Bacteroidales bacterium Barb7]
MDVLMLIIRNKVPKGLEILAPHAAKRNVGLRNDIANGVLKGQYKYKRCLQFNI